MMKVVASTKCKLGKMNELTTYMHITEFKKKKSQLSYRYFIRSYLAFIRYLDILVFTFFLFSIYMFLSLHSFLAKYGIEA